MLVEEVVDETVGGGLDLAVEPVVADEVVSVQLGEVVLVAGVVVANVGTGCELGSLFVFEWPCSPDSSGADFAGSGCGSFRDLVGELSVTGCEVEKDNDGAASSLRYLPSWQSRCLAPELLCRAIRR